jgi:outer membrane protein assembly factor BamB
MSGRHIACLVAVLFAAGLAAAQDEPLIQRDLPQFENFTWQIRADTVYPLEALLVQGLLPVSIKSAKTGKPALELVRLADGEVLWTAEVGAEPDAINASSDMIFVAFRDRVLGLSLKTGEPLWQQPVTAMLDSGWQTPPNFRQSQWFADLSTSGQGIGGVIYCHGDKTFVTIGGVIYCVEGKTGKIIWQADYGFKLSFPLIACGEVIVFSSNEGLVGLKADDGSTAWEHTDIQATPLFVLEDELYAATPNGLCRIDPSDGTIVWTCKEVSHDRNMKLYLADDQIIARGEYAAWALSRDNGEQRWAAENAGGQNAVANGCVFVRSAKGGDIYCYSTKEGKYIWNTPCSDMGGRFFVAGPSLMVLNAFNITAFDCAKGTALWRRVVGAGQGFDTSTFCSTDRAAFFRTSQWMCAADPRTGAWLSAVEGQFFFVSWMWASDTALYGHAGDPGGATIGGLNLKPANPK